jgi:hypothetical protein
MSHPTRPLLTLIVGLGLLGACGQRNRLPSQQDGAPDDGIILTDARKKDACVRPPNGCHSSSDCKQGYECDGCGADPCCPMCAVCYGTCRPKTPGACSSSKDCLDGSYCHFESGCGAHAGQCKPRPGGCYAVYKPVCGCDDKTYGNDCTAWSKGVSISYTGACSKNKCKDLFIEYKGEVQKAKVCCPMCNTPQCLKKIKHQLACGCTTYVHASTVALQKMALLEKEWDNLGCAKSWACPGVPCAAVSGASCVPDAVGSGTCQDLSTTPP